jgi:gamma-glutamyltranspeptidase/glutathione hydrolase
MLERGGNAVDAAVAAALAAGVVQPAGSGLGGGGFALVTVPGNAPWILDFREIAPSGITADAYRDAAGVVSPTASRVGGLAVAVPGESTGLYELLAERGTLPARVVAAPAIRLAREGFRVGPHLAGALSRTTYPEVNALFSVGERVAREGEVVRREALAQTLTLWAASDGRYLSAGAGGRAIAAEVKAAGGVLEAADLAAYATVDREPLVFRYRGFTVLTVPPPSSGGVAIGQMLRVLEGYDLGALGHGSADYLHLLTEVMKHAYADRAHHLGDPAFVTVPVDRLVADGRIEEIRRAIWPGRTFASEHYGALISPPEDAGTQHISVIDRDGVGVGLTTTINTSFGSGVAVESLGILLNNQMDDFAMAPGVPNAYGLVGGEANAVAAGKRPLSSMSPTVLLDARGQVVLVVGASGGSQIISSVLQVLLGVVDFGMSPQAAVAAPRIHHQWLPDTLFVEPEMSLETRRALEARGHHVEVQVSIASVQAVSAMTGAVEGGADPRKGGWPAGVW